jgi:SAM-dependent methyltransferase
MNIPPRSLGWYDENAPALAEDYEALDPTVVQAWLVGMLPRAPVLVLDIGAGTGRDAAWLAGLGHDVIAEEPLTAMRAQGERRHPNTGVRWVVDQLPALPAIYRLDLTFDVILLRGVWQHVAPGERERAMRKILGLLGPDGVLALTLRRGPVEVERAMYPVSLPEVERLARDQGAMVAHVDERPDQMAHAHVPWTRVALRLPDDGTGVLLLLSEMRTLLGTAPSISSATTRPAVQC